MGNGGVQFCLRGRAIHKAEGFVCAGGAGGCGGGACACGGVAGREAGGGIAAWCGPVAGGGWGCGG